jgi:hypothetical protein
MEQGKAWRQADSITQTLSRRVSKILKRGNDMKTYERRYQELEAMSKNWKTDDLFSSEMKKEINELSADASLLLANGCDAAEIKERIRALRALLDAQQTWALSQLEGYHAAPESPRVQWVM